MQNVFAGNHSLDVDQLCYKRECQFSRFEFHQCSGHMDVRWGFCIVYLRFQTWTSMPLLGSIIFASLALFEYALLLAIRYRTSGLRIGTGKPPPRFQLTQVHEIHKQTNCVQFSFQRIDGCSLIAFPSVFVIYAVVYTFCYHT